MISGIKTDRLPFSANPASNNSALMKDNLVPRVSLLPSQGSERRNPGNEVERKEVALEIILSIVCDFI